MPTETDEEVVVALKKKFDHVREVIKGLPRGNACVYNFQDYLNLCGLTEKSYILVLRSGIEKPTVFLKREPNAVMVNAYNPLILYMWKANIDTQYILDIYAVIMYITSYMTKPNKGISQITEKMKKTACTKPKRQ